MENTIGIIGAVILAASTYLAYQNMTSLKERIGERDDEIRKFERNERNFDSLVKELEETEDELEETKDELADTKAQLDSHLSQNSEIESRADEMKATADEKEQAAARATEQLEDIGDVDELVEELKNNQLALARLEGDIALKQQEIDKLTKEQESLALRSENKRGVVERYRSSKSDPELRTRVVRVFNSVGFVTLADGDNKGVVQDSVLNVVRDGRIVGKLQVSAVEATTSSADVIPESFEEGDGVRSGDVVVAGKQKG